MRNRDRIDRLDGSAGEARRLAVQRRARRQIECHVKPRRVRVEGKRQHPQRAGQARLDLQRANLAVEFDEDVVRLAEAVLAGQRLRHRAGNILRSDGAAGVGDDHLAKPAGVDSDELVRPDRIDDAISRDRAGGAEIGRPEDRYVGDRPRILDEVADADHVAADDHARFERGRQRRRLRGGNAAKRKQECQTGGDQAGHGADLPLFAFLSASIATSSAAFRRLR